LDKLGQCAFKLTLLEAGPASRSFVDMTILPKLRQTLATMGRVDGALYVLSRLLEVAFGRRVRIVKYYFVAQPVVQAVPSPSRSSFDVDWAEAGSPLFQQIARPSSILASRYRQGARCLAATVGGSELAGFLWFVVGPYDEDEVRVRFVPAPEECTAWDFDVTIMPRYRMGRLFATLWQRGAKEMAACGVTHTVSRISAFNPMSLASHRRLGARVVGQALFLCIGEWQAMRASGRKGWYLSWRESQRPSLRIRA